MYFQTTATMQGMVTIMRKTKLMRTVIMILLLSCLVAAFAGCESLQDSGVSHKEKFIEQLKQDADLDSETIEFTADPFAQRIALSWMYSINVKIDNGNIYLNDDLYDNVEIISNPKITYNTELLGCTDTVDDEKIAEVLKKIKNSENCYMLETKNSDGTSKEIAVYKIDDAYYFLSFLEDYEVLRIHYSNIK